MLRNYCYLIYASPTSAPGTRLVICGDDSTVRAGNPGREIDSFGEIRKLTIAQCRDALRPFVPRHVDPWQTILVYNHSDALLDKVRKLSHESYSL